MPSGGRKARGELLIYMCDERRIKKEGWEHDCLRCSSAESSEAQPDIVAKESSQRPAATLKRERRKNCRAPCAGRSHPTRPWEEGCLTRRRHFGSERRPKRGEGSGGRVGAETAVRKGNGGYPGIGDEEEVEGVAQGPTKMAVNLALEGDNAKMVKCDRLLCGSVMWISCWTHKRLQEQES